MASKPPPPIPPKPAHLNRGMHPNVPGKGPAPMPGQGGHGALPPTPGGPSLTTHGGRGPLPVPGGQPLGHGYNKPLPVPPGGPSLTNRQPVKPNYPAPPTPRFGGLVPMITGAIEAIDDIGGAGASDIWVVTMRGGAKVVVKAEKHFKVETADADRPMPSLAGPTMKAMNDVMMRASPTAAMEPVSAAEYNLLAASSLAPDNLKQNINATRQAGSSILLIKMKYDPSFAASSNNKFESMFPRDLMTDKQKAEAKVFFQELRGNEKAWRTLGQIVIADHLIGNADRINFEKGIVQNIGNLIFARDPITKKISHALGYDALDPFSDSAKNLYQTDITDWTENFGRFIQDKTRFPNMSSKIIDYINKERMVKLALNPFGPPEVIAFTNGLIIGWDKQANAIGAKVRAGKPVPSGIMARAKYLKWVK